MKVWVMGIVDSSEIRVFNSRELAFNEARKVWEKDCIQWESGEETYLDGLSELADSYTGGGDFFIDQILNVEEVVVEEDNDEKERERERDCVKSEHERLMKLYRMVDEIEDEDDDFDFLDDFDDEEEEDEPEEIKLNFLCDEMTIDKQPQTYIKPKKPVDIFDIENFCRRMFQDEEKPVIRPAKSLLRRRKFKAVEPTRERIRRKMIRDARSLADDDDSFDFM